MSVANVNYLYNNQQFLKVFNFVSFFFPNKLFLVHSISVEQSLGGVIIVVVKYFYMPSFFKKAKFSNSKALPAIKSSDFESVLLNGVANLTGAKGILDWWRHSGSRRSRAGDGSTSLLRGDEWFATARESWL